MTELFKNIHDLPRLNQSHQWADYVELLALVSADKFYSQGYLQDIEGEIEDIAVDMDDVDDEPELNNNLDDKLNRRWSDIKTCLQSRKQRFDDAWPFEFKNDVLYAKPNQQQPLHRLYIALLLASSLRYITKTRQTVITNSLETISYQLFCQLMPANTWTVKQFGAHQVNGYKGILFEKIKKLALDLNTKCLAEQEEFEESDSGDGGLDLVAWHSMGDNLGYIPIAFAQCGCSLKAVEYKQFEANPVNWSNKLQLHHPPANYYFTPQDFRKNSGHWDAQLGQVIMIDRSRILYLAKLYQLQSELFNWTHIDEAIASTLI
ncbi:MAG: hypothetical protein WAX77_08140 [Methylococcaceae bacterium]